jgi:hypothetical protein
MTREPPLSTRNLLPVTVRAAPRKVRDAGAEGFGTLDMAHLLMP